MNFVLSLINSILVFLPLQSVLMIVMKMAGCTDFYFATFFFFAITIISTLIDKTIKRGIFFVLLEFLIILLAIGLGEGNEKIIFISLTVLVVGMGIYQRFKNKKILGYGEMMMIVYGILGIIIVATGTKQMITLCVIFAVIYIVLKYVYEGLSNTYDFLEINQRIAELPEKTIKRKTRITMLPFVLIIFACVVIGVNSGLGELIGVLFLLLLNFLKGIFAREPIQADVIGTEEKLFEDLKNMNMDRIFEDMGERKMAPAILEPLAKIMLGAIILLIVIIVARALFELLKELIKSLYENKNSNEESELLIADEEKFFAFKKAKTLFSKMKDSLPNDVKIRRLYKKYIFKHKKLELSKNYTPLEISKTLNIDKSQNDEKVRKIYEKARYSPEECTSEDVSLMKSLIKEFSK